jgi:site-specific recombinase
MIAEYVRSLEGIQILGLLSLVVSFTLFCGILIRTMRTKPEYLRTMEGLPLDVEASTRVQRNEVRS